MPHVPKRFIKAMKELKLTSQERTNIVRIVTVVVVHVAIVEVDVTGIPRAVLGAV